MKMAPLKNLEREYQIIDDDFRGFCASHGIFSVEDFLLRDLYVLAAFAEQQNNADKLKEGIAQILSILDSQCRPLLNGIELLNDARQNKHILSTGNEGVDVLLQGGFREGQLTELVGPSSSGKTQTVKIKRMPLSPFHDSSWRITSVERSSICMQAATSVSVKHKASVLYLDTGNSFSAKRIACFIGQNSEKANHKFVQKVMSRISCQPVYDIFQMFDVLQHLELNLRSQTKIGGDRMQMLIIDSISSLITPILGGRGSQGRALMVSAGYLLKKLAHEYNLSVLVTNHTVGGAAGTSKPALGETWKSIPHVRLLLSRDHQSNLCTMSILKHTSTASGKTARLMIDNYQQH